MRSQNGSVWAASVTDTRPACCAATMSAALWRGPVAPNGRRPRSSCPAAGDRGAAGRVAVVPELVLAARVRARQARGRAPRAERHARRTRRAWSRGQRVARLGVAPAPSAPCASRRTARAGPAPIRVAARTPSRASRPTNRRAESLHEPANRSSRPCQIQEGSMLFLGR